MSEPTLGEVMRRLDDLARQLLLLATEMRDERTHAATTFVRQDVWREARAADLAAVREVDSEVDTLKTEKKRNEDFRRQVSLGSALAVLGLLGSLGLAVFSLLTGGG